MHIFHDQVELQYERPHGLVINIFWDRSINW